MFREICPSLPPWIFHPSWSPKIFPPSMSELSPNNKNIITNHQYWWVDITVGIGGIQKTTIFFVGLMYVDGVLWHSMTPHTSLICNMHLHDVEQYHEGRDVLSRIVLFQAWCSSTLDFYGPKAAPLRKVNCGGFFCAKCAGFGQADLTKETQKKQTTNRKIITT